MELKCSKCGTYMKRDWSMGVAYCPTCNPKEK